METFPILLYVAAFFGLGTNNAADNGGAVNLRTGVVNQYVLSNGAMNYDKPTSQTELTVNFGEGELNGFYIDLWNSTPFERYGENFGTEQDYGIGWSGKLSDKISDANVDISVTYCDEPNLNAFGSDDGISTKVKFSYQLPKDFNIFASYENNAVMPKSSYNGGHYFSFGVNKSFSFMDERLIANTGISPLYDTGTFGYSSGWILKGNLELDWKLVGGLSLVLPQVNFYAPLTIHDQMEEGGREFSKTVFVGLNLSL